MSTRNLEGALPPIKNLKGGSKYSDGVYITQLLDKADRSMSLSYRKRMDDAIFGEVSKIPVFNDFKKDIEDLEKSDEFRMNYIKSRSFALLPKDSKTSVKPVKPPSILFKIYSKLLNSENAAKTISAIKIMLKLYFKKNGISPPTNVEEQPGEIDPISEEELALQTLIDDHLHLLKTVRNKIELLLNGTDLEPMNKHRKHWNQGYISARTPNEASDVANTKDLKSRFKLAIGELNHWVKDVIEQVIIKKRACEMQMIDTQTELKKLTATHKKLCTQFEKLKIEKAKKVTELEGTKQELSAINAKLNNKFKEPNKVETSVQTLVNCKNVPFTIVAEKILEAKISSKLKPIMSIIHKLEEGKIDDIPLPKDKVADFMHSAYIKKAESITTHNNSMLNFEDILYSIFEQRFLFKKKIRIKCQQFLIGLREYALTDERMDDFKKFIGFENSNKYPPEILELYIKTMKSTEESFSVILSEEAENISLAIEKAYKNILVVFSNASDLMKQEILISMIYESNFYCDGKLQHAKKEYQRIRKFILSKVRNEEEKTEFTSNVEVLLPEIIKEDLAEGTLQNYVYKDSKSFMRFTHEMRIPIKKILSIGLRTAIRFYETAKAFYSKLFNTADANNDGYIDYYEFTNLIKSIDPERPRWKIIAIFEMTAGGSDGTNVLTEDVKINFNQFLECALSHSLMNNLMGGQNAGRKKNT